MFRENDMSPEALPPRSSILEGVQRIVAEQLGQAAEEIAENHHLENDLGCDSLDIVETGFPPDAADATHQDGFLCSCPEEGTCTITLSPATGLIRVPPMCRHEGCNHFVRHVFGRESVQHKFSVAFSNFVSEIRFQQESHDGRSEPLG